MILFINYLPCFSATCGTAALKNTFKTFNAKTKDTKKTKDFFVSSRLRVSFDFCFPLNAAQRAGTRARPYECRREIANAFVGADPCVGPALIRRKALPAAQDFLRVFASDLIFAFPLNAAQRAGPRARPYKSATEKKKAQRLKEKRALHTIFLVSLCLRVGFES